MNESERCDSRLAGIDMGAVVLDVVLACELEAGHEGDHKSVDVTWPNDESSQSEGTP